MLALSLAWFDFDIHTVAVTELLCTPLAVHCYHGRRQAGARTEVGWQGDKVCPRDQGWETGHGELSRVTRFMYLWFIQ